VRYNEVIFRVDGSPKIGLGHLVRCLALAQMLDEHFRISFASKEIPVEIISELNSLGYTLMVINSEEDFLNGLTRDNLVVLDHYDLDSAYQQNIKEKGCKLICIDDLHNKVFFADVIINHAPGMFAQDYEAQLYTQFALGLDYVLLRPVFLKNALKKKIQKPLGTVFVCFGGSDSKNITQVVVDILKSDPRFKHVIVVTGAAYEKPEKLSASVGQDERFSFFHAVDSLTMSKLINECQLAIVPSSGILQEVISLGCRVISGAYVNNQKDIYEKYLAIGGFESAGGFLKVEIEEAINNVFLDKNRPNKVFIDGRSGIRLLNVFRQLCGDEIVLRDVIEADQFKTFDWANDKLVRAFSFNQQEIVFEEHSSWFLKKANSPDCYYFIAEMDKVAIGSIRFDVQDDEAVVSYLLDPSFHGKGLGILLLKKGLEMLINKKDMRIIQITGFVMPQNIASVKAFERLGYARTLENENYKFIKKIVQ